MKKLILIMLAFVFTASVFVACHDDNGTTAQPIVGTWKLVERYTNGNAVSLNACQMEETYIFGPDQFTHELYANGGKPGAAYKSTLGGDDDDDEGSDDEEESDDHSSDDDDESDESTDDGTTPTDDSTDDSTDDGGSGGGSGTCVVSDMVIGYWSVNHNNYTFTVDGTAEVKTIFFTDANNRFYVEKTTTVNGASVVTRNVYQKQ